MKPQVICYSSSTSSDGFLFLSKENSNFSPYLQGTTHYPNSFWSCSLPLFPPRHLSSLSSSFPLLHIHSPSQRLFNGCSLYLQFLLIHVASPSSLLSVCSNITSLLRPILTELSKLLFPPPHCPSPLTLLCCVIFLNSYHLPNYKCLFITRGPVPEFMHEWGPSVWLVIRANWGHL